MMQPAKEELEISKILEAEKPPMYRKGIKILWIVLLLGTMSLAAFMFWKGKEKRSLPQYVTQEVRRGDLTVIVTATGTLQPTNKVDVGSELSGIVKSVEVDYNDRVKVGQVLARLDTSKLEAQISQAKGALEAAKAKVLQAEATVRETQSKLSQLRRVWELSERKVPSLIELDGAQASFERAKADEASAKAAVAQAQASLEAYQTDLSKTVIRSPISGIVLTRSVEPGQTVAASFQAPVLFTLAEDLTQMELHVNVDEADIGKVREGQRATFTVSAYPNRTFEAHITQARFGSSTTSGVVTYETVLRVRNADLSLRPGMTATADIVVKEVKDALLVPNGALRFTPPLTEEKTASGGNLISKLLPRPPRPSSKTSEGASGRKREQSVYILRDGRPFAVPIEIGDSDGTLTEVISGDLRVGMTVIVDMEAQGK